MNGRALAETVQNPTAPFKEQATLLLSRNCRFRSCVSPMRRLDIGHVSVR
jgi:hypothetical protein